MASNKTRTTILIPRDLRDAAKLADINISRFVTKRLREFFTERQKFSGASYSGSNPDMPVCRDNRRVQRGRTPAAARRDNARNTANPRQRLQANPEIYAQNYAQPHPRPQSRALEIVTQENAVSTESFIYKPVLRTHRGRVITSPLFVPPPFPIASLFCQVSNRDTIEAERHGCFIPLD